LVHTSSEAVTGFVDRVSLYDELQDSVTQEMITKNILYILSDQGLNVSGSIFSIIISWNASGSVSGNPCPDSSKRNKSFLGASTLVK